MGQPTILAVAGHHAWLLHDPGQHKIIRMYQDKLLHVTQLGSSQVPRDQKQVLHNCSLLVKEIREKKLPTLLVSAAL